MNWLIASIPFWTVGIFFFCAMIYGVVLIGNNPENCSEDTKLWKGAVLAFFLSAVLLPIAAWMVS